MLHSYPLTLFTFEESHIDEKTQELKGKDDIVVEKEMIIKEKSDSIASLRGEMASLQARHFIPLTYSFILYAFVVLF